MNLIEAKTWADEMDIMVTVCDREGIIVYMNQASILGFHRYGGSELIGKSLMNCHQPKSQEHIKNMLQHPEVNTYLIQKDNENRLIRQLPWMEDGVFKGIIELIFSVPDDIYKRL